VIAAITSFLARSVLMQSPIGALLKGGWTVLRQIPKAAWEVITVLGYVAALVALHQHEAGRAIAAAKAEQKAADDRVLAETVTGYRKAAEQARQADAANKARTEAEQHAINERSSHDYEARIADARARAEQLRRQLAEGAAHSRGAGAAPVPGVPAATGRPAQGADPNGLSIDERLTATEQAIQLDELIHWVRRQAAVNPNQGKR
jgi:hypothetical protein